MSGTFFASADLVSLIHRVVCFQLRLGEPAGSRAVYGILNARSNDFGYRHSTYVSIPPNALQHRAWHNGAWIELKFVMSCFC